MKVRLSRQARNRLREIIAYIAIDSPRNARLVKERFNDAFRQLAVHPESGRPGRVDGTRELLVAHTSHIVPYRVIGQHVEIIDLLHEAKDWPESFDND